MNNRTDEQLVAAYLDGDNEALEFLIQKYLSPVYNFAFIFIKNADDAEEVAQLVFIKIWKNIYKFSDEYKFKSWVFTLAKNTILDWLKVKKAIPFSALDNANLEDFNFSDSLVSDQLSPLDSIVIDEDRQELRQAVNDLPPKYRAALDFHYNEGLKFREIAKITRESIDTIKTRHRRALQYLKKILSK